MTGKTVGDQADVSLDNPPKSGGLAGGRFSQIFHAGESAEDHDGEAASPEQKQPRSALADLIIHLPRAIGRVVRKPFAFCAFNGAGQPRFWLRRLLFHKNGKVRKRYRKLVYRSDGEARRAFEPYFRCRLPYSSRMLEICALAQSVARAPRRLQPGNGAILIAADFLPLYDRQSGGLRLKTLIDMIGARGDRVVFATLLPKSKMPGTLATNEGRTKYESALRKANVVEIIYGLDEFERRLEGKNLQFRCAFLSFPGVAEAFLPLIRAERPETLIYYDMVDFHALRMEREAALSHDKELVVAAAAMKALELSLAAAADVTIAISADEKKAVLDLAPTAVVEVLPNIFKVPADPLKGPEGRRDLVFVGGFWHKPNSDAVTWFVEEIWPLIRQEKGDCRFFVAGSNPGREVQALAKIPGVEVLGYVADLTPLYDSARVCVAPLRFGAGLKGKVCESMAHGVPVVATSIAAEGMSPGEGGHILVADSPRAFARHVLNLLDDDRLWTTVQSEGSSYLGAHYSVQAVAKTVESLFYG